MARDLVVKARIEAEDAASPTIAKVEDNFGKLGDKATEVVRQLDAMGAAANTLAEKVATNNQVVKEADALFRAHKITLEEFNQISKEAAAANDALKQSLNGVSDASGSFDKVGSSLSEFASAAIERIATVAVGFATLNKVIDETVQAAKMEGVSANIRDQLGGSEDALNGFVASLRAAANQTIATDEALTTASRAVLLGIPIEKMSKIMEVAHDNAVRLGIDTSDAFEKLTHAIEMAGGMMSGMAFARAGIFVESKKALDDFAKAHGVATESLTKEQQIMISTEATISAYNARIASVGKAHSEAADKIQSASAAISEFNGSLGDLFTGSAGSSAGFFATLIGGMAVFLQNMKETKQEAFNVGDALDMWARGIGNVVPVIDSLNGKTREQVEAMDAAAAANRRLADSTTALTAAQDLAQYGAAYLGVKLGTDVVAGAEGARVAFEGLVAAQKAGVSVSENDLVRAFDGWAASIQKAREELLKTSDASDSSSAAQNRHAEAMAKLDESYRALSSAARTLGIDLSAGNAATDAAVSGTEAHAAAMDRGATSAATYADTLASRVVPVLDRVIEKIAMTSRAFDELSAAQGRSAAVSAALANGGTLSMGGTRVELPGGGSRLTSGAGFGGTYGSQTRFVSDSTYIYNPGSGRVEKY